MRQSSGQLGEFKTRTIKNLANKARANYNDLIGISKNWTKAERTVAILQRMGASYCSLVMDKHDNLIVYKGKGRHTTAEKESIEVRGDLRKELNSVRKDLLMNDGQDILLAISVATDEMIRSMQMFPEVQFVDTIANVNRQKRSMLVAILKHSSGKCFIGNISILPCEREWVFYKIYEVCFPFLYGERTISRIRLILTDDDKAERAAIAAIKAILKEYKKILHMLCVFHGIIMKMHETVFPLLPRRRGNKKLLSKKGEVYGKYIKPFFVCLVSNVVNVPFTIKLPR